MNKLFDEIFQVKKGNNSFKEWFDQTVVTICKSLFNKQVISKYANLEEFKFKMQQEEFEDTKGGNKNL